MSRPVRCHARRAGLGSVQVFTYLVSTRIHGISEPSSHQRSKQTKPDAIRGERHEAASSAHLVGQEKEGHHRPSLQQGASRQCQKPQWRAELARPQASAHPVGHRKAISEPSSQKRHGRPSAILGPNHRKSNHLVTPQWQAQLASIPPEGSHRQQSAGHLPEGAPASRARKATPSDKASSEPSSQNGRPQKGGW